VSNVNLIRFKDWVFDKNEISSVEIIENEGTPKDEFDRLSHSVKIRIKNGMSYELICRSLYDARENLDILTADLEPHLLGRRHDTYIISQIYSCREAINEVRIELKQLNKRLSKRKVI
jgi:hypothetical protein